MSVQTITALFVAGAALLSTGLHSSVSAAEDTRLGSFQATLWLRNPQVPLCGAAIVDERNLVTVASCIFNDTIRLPTNNLQLSLGEDSGRFFDVAYSYVPDEYDHHAGLPDYMAVVRLRGQLPEDGSWSAIPLSASGLPATGDRCHLTIWNIKTSSLQRIPVTVVDATACPMAAQTPPPADSFCVEAAGDRKALSGGGWPVECAGLLAGAAWAPLDSSGRVVAGVRPAWVSDVVSRQDSAALSLLQSTVVGLLGAALSIASLFVYSKF